MRLKLRRKRDVRVKFTTHLSSSSLLLHTTECPPYMVPLSINRISKLTNSEVTDYDFLLKLSYLQYKCSLLFVL